MVKQNKKLCMAMVGGLSCCSAEGKSPILSIPVEVSSDKPWVDPSYACMF